jgi:hypothetical protein
MHCPDCGSPLRNPERCDCGWLAPIADLGRHLKSLEKREELVELQNMTENLETMLATTAAQDVKAQTKLSLAIHMQRLREQKLSAEIELIELGESNPERRAELNKTVEEWKENFPAFKKRYQAVRDWLIKWDAQRLAKKTAQTVLPQPARSKRAQQRAQRDEQIWEIIQTGKEGIEYCKLMDERAIKGKWANFRGYVKAYYADDETREKIYKEKDRITRRMKTK